jgi:RNA polymerase sigma factor (sigma-70 family)
MQQRDEAASEPEGQADERQVELIRLAVEAQLELLTRDARVFVYKLGVPGDRESAAADALQTMVITAIRLADRYDPSRPAYPWLRTLLFNAVRSICRRNRLDRHRSPTLTDIAARAAREQRARGESVSGLSEDEILGRLGARHLDPEGDGDAAEELERWFAPLGAGEREILRLAYEEEMNGAELGARLGITAGAAYTRLSRARSRLRDVIQSTGNGEN